MLLLRRLDPCGQARKSVMHTSLNWAVLVKNVNAWLQFWAEWTLVYDLLMCSQNSPNFLLERAWVLQNPEATSGSALALPPVFAWVHSWFISHISCPQRLKSSGSAWSQMGTTKCLHKAGVRLIDQLSGSKPQALLQPTVPWRPPYLLCWDPDWRLGLENLHSQPLWWLHTLSLEKDCFEIFIWCLWLQSEIWKSRKSHSGARWREKSVTFMV